MDFMLTCAISMTHNNEGPLLIPNEPKLANLTLNASALPYNEAIFAKRRDETFAYLIGQTAIAGVALIM